MNYNSEEAAAEGGGDLSILQMFFPKMCSKDFKNCFVEQSCSLMLEKIAWQDSNLQKQPMALASRLLAETQQVSPAFQNLSSSFTNETFLINCFLIYTR